MLARQVTDLAGCWLLWIARRVFATNIRIQMSLGAGAVAVRRDGLVMDVID